MQLHYLLPVVVVTTVSKSDMHSSFNIAVTLYNSCCKLTTQLLYT